MVIMSFSAGTLKGRGFVPGCCQRDGKNLNGGRVCKPMTRCLKFPFHRRKSCSPLKRSCFILGALPHLMGQRGGSLLLEPARALGHVSGHGESDPAPSGLGYCFRSGRTRHTDSPHPPPALSSELWTTSPSPASQGQSGALQPLSCTNLQKGRTLGTQLPFS